MRSDLDTPAGFTEARDHAIEDYAVAEWLSAGDDEYKAPLVYGFWCGALWVKWLHEGRTKYPNGSDLPGAKEYAKLREN